MSGEEELERLVEAALASPKYRTIAPELVRAVAAEELTKRRPKDALKAVKSKLHQVAAVYVDGAPQYGAWLAELAAANEPEQRRAVCARIMARHASTRERLPILEEFYARVFAGLPPVQSIADLGCGLNPLALPWMGLAAGARYYACDVFTDQAAFLNHCFPLLGVDGRAETCDLVHAPGCPQADVALLLKVLPNLEQMEKGAASRLLDAVRAPVLIVSYPAHSLGGRRKGMPSHYAAQFEALAEGRGWRVERMDFATELAFRVFTTAGRDAGASLDAASSGPAATRSAAA